MIGGSQTPHAVRPQKREPIHIEWEDYEGFELDCKVHWNFACLTRDFTDSNGETWSHVHSEITGQGRWTTQSFHVWRRQSDNTLWGYHSVEGSTELQEGYDPSDPILYPVREVPAVRYEVNL